MTGMQPLWPEWLDRHIRQVTGPEDDFDPEANGDPDSAVGEEDEDNDRDDTACGATIPDSG